MNRILLFSLLTLGWWGCELQDPTVGVDVSQIISLEANNLTLLADGQSRTTLTATLGPLADANNAITFTTEKGHFAEAPSSDPQTISLTASGKSAIATLISDSEAAEEVVVTARVSNFVAPINLNFERAFPQDLTMVADKQTVSTDRIDFAKVTVELFRDEGVPSGNARIDLELIPQDTSSAEVLPFVYTIGNLATFNVKSGNGMPGNVLLRCTTAGEAGTELQRELEISFQ